MLKAILFDLGDTLLDTQPTPFWDVFTQGGREGYAYLQSLGQPLPPFPRYFASHRWAIQLSFIRTRLSGGEVNCGHILAKLCRNMHLKLSEEQLHELAWRWYQPTSQRSSVAPETRRVLGRLRARGLRLAIVSNTFVPGRVLDRHLQAEGLLEFFPCRVYSSEAGIRKPNPRIFRLALRELDVEPAEAVFVGDNLRADVVGAHRTGMLGILKRPGSETRTHGTAEHLVRNIQELYQLLPLLGAPVEPPEADAALGAGVNCPV